MVASAHSPTAAATLRRGERVYGLRLGLFRRTPDGFRRLWTNADKSGSGELPLTEIELLVVDLTGDGTPEVCLRWGDFAWDTRSDVNFDVYTYRQGAMVQIGHIFGRELNNIEDVDGDGRYEIIDRFMIGPSDSSVMVRIDNYETCPHWQDVYAYRDGRYTLQTTAFRDSFEVTKRVIQGALHQCPNDWELWEYQGLAHEREGHPRDALDAYRKSEKLCKADVERAKDDYERGRIEPRLRGIRERIAQVKENL